MSLAQLIDVDAQQVPALKRVLPGNPAASYLIQKVESMAAIGAPMPPGEPLLATEIQQLELWITQGAPNN